MNKLRIGGRLYLGFGAVVVIFLTAVGIAYMNLANLAAANDINVHTYEVTGKVNGALESLINIETGQRGFALTGDASSLEPYNAGKTAFRKYLNDAMALTADNAQQQERLKRLGQAQEAWLSAGIDPVIAQRRAATDGVIDGVVATVKEGKGKKGMDAMRVLITEINGAETALLAQRSKDAAALRAQTAAWLLGGALAGTLLAALVAIVLRRNIVHPLRQAVDLAKRVAEGDLTVTVESNSSDEIGELLEALKVMNDGLARIVSQVRTGTDTIARASTEITSGNLDLSSRTEQQASSLEETASSMEELTSTVKQNADNARQAHQLAATASDVAVRGGAAVSQVVETMGAINDSAKKIVDIIGVIDGIAFQTNILALNAAVEAARAGEQGRGFAVVASEVRNLAQRSAGAAKEIKLLIDTSVEKADLGTRLVDQAGLTMDEVVSSVRRVNDIISEIASASDEQRAGIEQVNSAINQMDEVTQQNAALVEQAAAASASMQEQAAQLAEVVSVFKLDGSMETVAADPVRTPALERSSAPVRKEASRKAIAAAPRARAAAAAAAPAAAAPKDEWEEF